MNRVETNSKQNARTSTNTVRIVLAEDPALARTGIRQLVEKSPGMPVVPEIGLVQYAIRAGLLSL